MERPHNLQSTEPSQAIDPTHIDLGAIFGLIWRRKLIVGTIFLTFSAVGLIYLSCVTPTYRATTRLLIDRKDVSLEKKTPPRYDPAFVATQAEIIRSREVVDRALRSYTPTGLESSGDPVGAVIGSIRVKPIEGTSVMELSYRCSDGRVAERMLEAVADSYAEYLRDLERNNQSQTLTFLTRTEKGIREELEKKEAEYRDLLKSSPLVNVGTVKGRVQTEYLTNLGKAFAEAQTRRLQLENQALVWVKPPALQASTNSERWLPDVLQTSTSNVPPDRQVALASVLALPQLDNVNHSADVRAVESELHASRAWEKEFEDGRYGDRHPDLQRVRFQIQSLQARLREMLVAIPKLVEDQLSVARKHEQEMEELYEGELEATKTLDLYQLQGQQHRDAIERLRTVHDSILAQMHARRLAGPSFANGHGIQVTSIGEPRASSDPAWPIPGVVMCVCSAIGLCLGVGLAVCVDRWATRQPPLIPGSPTPSDSEVAA